MVLFSEMFLSDLINDPVVDKLQENIGRVKDILVSLDKSFPKVLGILVKKNDGKRSVILIDEIDLIGKQFVSTKQVKEKIPFTIQRSGEILALQDIVDKQIVDVTGAKVIRVNDLKLAKIDQEVHLIAADVGLKGMLRRLGLENFFSFIFGIFGRPVPESLIGWDHVDLLKHPTDAPIALTIPHQQLQGLHPAEIADVISRVHTGERTAIFESLSEKTAAEALHELEPKIQAMLLLTLNTKKALGILEKMPLDEAADVLGDIPLDRAEEFLRLLRPKRAQKIKELMRHPEKTAGGLMNTEFLTIPYNLTCDEAIKVIRQSAPAAETINYIYIIDEKEALAGILSIKHLIISPPETKISSIMKTKIISVTEKTDERQIADLISKYNLLAVPVVDEQHKIKGIVMVDDIIDYILPPISRRKKHMLG